MVRLKKHTQKKHKKAS